MGFRDYDPGLNRFLSRDMYTGALADLNLGTDPWNLNRYAFTGGNPISLVELDGHWSFGGAWDAAKDAVSSGVDYIQETGDGLKDASVGDNVKGVATGAVNGAAETVLSTGELVDPSRFLNVFGLSSVTDLQREAYDSQIKSRLPQGSEAGRRVGGFGAFIASLFTPGGAAAKTATVAAKNKGLLSKIGNGLANMFRRNKCGPNSFTPDTAVVMADGSSKPIEEVNVGDRVLATDENTGKTVARPVVALIVGEGQKQLVDVTVDTDGDRGDQTGTVIATDGHPFWVVNDHRWTDAGQLRPGDRLRTPDGLLVTVLATRQHTEHRRVHNLTIDGVHTYYVMAGTTPVLVHNTGCWSTSTERAGDLAGKYTPGQSTRDPASQWYHEDLSNEELLANINNAAEGDGIVVSRNGTILGGHHRWDELQTRINDGRIDPNTEIRIHVYGGE